MLLIFLTIHLFQFRFADTEQYWMITLTFFRPVVPASYTMPLTLAFHRGVGALAHRGLLPFRELVRGSFPAPHHHDPNKMLPNFAFWVMVGCSTRPPCTVAFLAVLFRRTAS